MKLVVTLLASVAILFAQNIINPHDYQLSEADKNKNCIECHTANLEEIGRESVYALSPLACFSCHDGVSALDRSINIPGSGGFFSTNNYALNLSNELKNIVLDRIVIAGNNIDISYGHPVSILYVEGLSKLKSKDTPIINWANASIINDILIDGKIECASCHNPHDKTTRLYLRHNNGSILCTTCHNK